MENCALVYGLSVFWLALAVVHVAFPDIQVDGITVSLLVLAATPFLGKIFKSLKLPGGVEVEWQELRKVEADLKGTGLLPAAPATEEPLFVSVAAQDPNLALAGLRLEIERKLRTLAGTESPGRPRGIRQLMDDLRSRDLLTSQEASILADLAGTLNTAVHGGHVSEDVLRWALDVGPRLLQGLDERITKGRSR